jgi:uncharacterized membrane protein
MPMLSLRDVNALRRRGLIAGGGYFKAASLVRDENAWADWGGRAVLAVGAGHLLAGIVFFFAYNWADMPAVAKFAVIEADIVLACAGSWLAGFERPVGQALLIGASVLVGVLLAVIGQVYNTGADAYSLFAAWTLLILPWTVASRSAAHWCVWLVVSHCAARLYGEQALIADGLITQAVLEVGLGAHAALALLLRELAAAKGMAWLSERWTRIILVVATLVLLFIPAAAYVLDWQGGAVAPAAFVVALALGAAVYRRWLPDFAASAAVIGFGALFGIAVGYRAIEEMLGFDWDDTLRVLASFGLLVLWSAATVGLAARLLQALRQRLEPQPP